MSNTTDIALARKSVAAVSGGKDSNADGWMTMWCNTNWGDLLQPAPLSLALLGSIMVIASSTDDFSLVEPPHPGVEPFKWEYASRPDSFKTCLMQMVGDSYTAFETTHKNMEIVSHRTQSMPALIKDAVEILNKASPQEMELLFPDKIDSLTEACNAALAAGKACENAFDKLCGLAQEMVVACTYRAGSAEQALRANEVHLAVLKTQKEGDEQALKIAKDTHSLYRQSFQGAEEQFRSAVNQVPAGWDLMGMTVVESMTNLVTSAANTYLSTMNVEAQAAKAGIGMVTSKSGSDPAAQSAAGTGPNIVPGAAPPPAANGVSSQPNAATLTDEGVQQASKVLGYLRCLRSLLNEAGQTPDWEEISGRDASKQGGAMFIQSTLENTRGRLDTQKAISGQLAQIIDESLAIAKRMIEVSGSASRADDAFDKDRPATDKLVIKNEALVTACNAALQQTGVPAQSQATPPPAVSAGSGSAVKAAVESAKFKVDQTRAALEASRQSFTAATSSLMEKQSAITKTIGEITELELTGANLQKMLPVLKKAVGAFGTLRAQFSQLVQFFTSVSNLLSDVLGPSLSDFVKTISRSEQLVLGGVSLSDFLKGTIFGAMAMPMRVALLAGKIAETYMKVSVDLIMPALRNVGSMMSFQETDASGKPDAAFIARLQKNQRDLSQQANEASLKIVALVQQDQKKFSSDIDARIKKIQDTTKQAFPAVTEPPPPHIAAVIDTHVTEFKSVKKTDAIATGLGTNLNGDVDF